jgi:hypothetical protein
MREYDISSESARKVYAALEGVGLLEREFDLSGILRLVLDYARRVVRAESVEGGFTLDPNTGIPAFYSKITFREPGVDLRQRGFLSVDGLLASANDALTKAGYQLWVLLDRLDVAFAETNELERNALRALFRVYRDVSGYDAIKLKIFLRTDIWERITDVGFREASHITKFVVLQWASPSLLNLVVRRLLKNDHIIQAFGMDREGVLRDFSAQRELFYRFFPPQVEQGTRKPSTFDWMVSRCADGTVKTAPRELIHLLISIREKEIERLERGEEAPPDEQLFDRSVFKGALPTVSEARLVQTLYAEHPDLRELITRLSGEKTEQTLESLCALWELTRYEASEKGQQLIEIGFFQPRGSRDQPTFWVPFLYRDGLKMSQGLADEPEMIPEEGAQGRLPI